MGCVSLKKERLSPILPSKTVNGLLRVTIEQANIFKPPSKMFSMDPYLKIKMSNQQYRGFIHRKAGRLDLFNESFEFIINSCYKSEGRSVCIEVWNQHMLGDKMIGTGTIDIDPIINFDEKNMIGSQVLNVSYEHQKGDEENLQNESRKCQSKRKLYLSQGVQQVGYLKTSFQFIQQPAVIIGFKFIYANMRRASSIFTTMNIRISVVAGQEVLTTQKQKDNDTKNPPSWEDQILMFNIPSSLKYCLIRVLDDDKQVGRYKLQFSEIINKKGQHKFTEQLQSNHAISGVIKFVALVGVNSIVNDSRNILRRQESEQRIQTKSQTSLGTRLQFPLGKQAKYYESQAKTNFQTQTNEQQMSKYTTKPENSILFIDQHQLRR